MWRVLFYLPALIGGAGEALMLTLVWDRHGLVNWLLSTVGIDEQAWFQNPTYAMPALILSRYWTIGNIILLFLAARASVPKDLYEVADIDGASAWRSFRAITLPLMTPIILFNLVLGIITSLQVFTQVMILTEGGPAGATRLVGIYIYELAFVNQRFGYAAAVSWSLFVVALLVSLLLIRTSVEMGPLQLRRVADGGRLTMATTRRAPARRRLRFAPIGRTFVLLIGVACDVAAVRVRGYDVAQVRRGVVRQPLLVDPKGADPHQLSSRSSPSTSRSAGPSTPSWWSWSRSSGPW